MKKILAVEPIAPMSAVDVELEIIEQQDNNILSRNWRGEYIKLEPSSEKDGKTIYRVTDQSFDRIKLK